MQIFEFIMVLVSIIIGLGIAELLTGFARLLASRNSVQRYWVHTLIIMAIFLVHLQIWWESWDMHRVPEWSFLGLLLMIATPVFLFLIAHLLYPEQISGSDMREYYYQNVFFPPANRLFCPGLFEKQGDAFDVGSDDDCVGLLGCSVYELLDRRVLIQVRPAP